MNYTTKQLIALMNIHGVSGNEKNVRDYLIKEMALLVDSMKVDEYGNLLAEKKMGNGKGAKVLLSAHMDTVRGVRKDMKLVIDKRKGKNNYVISADNGPCGADDRAGIAIILTVLKNLQNIKTFNGTVKVAFSREEEIGCVGASHIDPKWYKDVDLAIVVDRKGSRDIVTGCFNAFCSNAVGRFMEDVSQVASLNYKACEGGISDACVFSENGVNSINLSAGYYNEHTKDEFVRVVEMMDTIKLILQVFPQINGFYKSFGKVPSYNKWVLDYDDGRYAYSDDYAVSNVEYGNNYSYDGNTEVWVVESEHGIIVESGFDSVELGVKDIERIIEIYNKNMKISS